MMGFSDDVARFTSTVDRRHKLLVDKVVDAAKESIVEGSTVTGAPGQPVSGDDKGYDLKESFFRNRIGEHEWLVGTKLFYAPWIEDGMLPSGKRLVQRSPVGGPHSVALTRAGWVRLVEMVNADVSR